MIGDDPILGRVRYCRGCEEWWPDDAEFFYTDPGSAIPESRCRACISERRAVWRQNHRSDRQARARELYAAKLDHPVGRTRPRKDAA